MKNVNSISETIVRCTIIIGDQFIFIVLSLLQLTILYQNSNGAWCGSVVIASVTSVL